MSHSRINIHRSVFRVVDDRGDLEELGHVEEDGADDDGDQVLRHAGALVLHQARAAVLLRTRGNIFRISRVPQFHRGPADRPVALHGDADRHEDGASQADGGQRVQKPN